MMQCPATQLHYTLEHKGREYHINKEALPPEDGYRPEDQDAIRNVFIGMFCELVGIRGEVPQKICFVISNKALEEKNKTLEYIHKNFISIMEKTYHLYLYVESTENLMVADDNILVRKSFILKDNIYK